MKYVYSPKQTSSLVHSCAYTQQAICIPITPTFRGLSIDIQQVLTLHKNFKPFVSNILVGSQIWVSSLDYVKKTYKDYNISSVCITKDNLLKTKTIRLVQYATQCTPIR
jgi:hypothetical protein